MTSTPTHTFENLDGEPEWDEDFAEELLGRTLFVALTFEEPDGTISGTQQVYGIVELCTPEEGIHIRQDDGELFTIPPMLDAIDHASPGLYRMTEEDEAVENPDFTVGITVTKPPRN